MATSIPACPPADLPPSFGEIAEGSLARQPEMLTFLAGLFGRYPFTSAGGVVDDGEFYFALENQTRVFYSKYFFFEPFSADSVVLHELAHQWIGDNTPVAAWQHIWLNEGFASYAEWLWSEAEGLGTAQEIFDFYHAVFPPGDPFWSVVIGDPGTDHLFDWPCTCAAR